MSASGFKRLGIKSGPTECESVALSNEPFQATKHKHDLIYEVCPLAIRAFFLGYSFSLGIVNYNTALPKWKGFGIYTVILSTFHVTEFLAVTMTNPMSSSSDSFVINHSIAYTVAAGISWIEYFMEGYYFPKTKENLIFLIIGVTLCAAGELFRKIAIYTAEKNFNHMIQDKKIDGHVLITHGIYSICRHPSYVGWFYWSIGTQIILQNPICLMIYTFISWIFFYDRISIEETSLLNFFGYSYIQYQNQVRTGLPFISGCNSLKDC
ncbi:protein-S-isoprenylcysteine O-methyltransferase [Phymastichus coffea]|uniref:protein-S-isoprenylcysteine O-methyltransferase n=1 Tax=Phymastichus coffea TaxID=108790 RepID=UPI00273ABAFE|nr:protein-S-isoprenylcysteine O-methyltransferase [Phymastichus coffea]